MLEERPKLEEAVQAVCSRENFTIRRVPTDHAGGKWQLRYESSIGQSGNLDVDLRDLFDVHLLLTQQELDPQMLRLAFVVYGAMNRVDWRSVSIDNVNFNARELESSLIPALMIK